jgi:membrane-associated phospholipid phosphatase
VREDRPAGDPVDPPAGPVGAPRWWWPVGGLLAVGLLLVSVQVMLGIGLVHVDLAVHFDAWRRPFEHFREPALILQDLGQRGPVAVAVGACAAWLARRRRTVRPLTLFVASIVGLNLAVGTVKVLTARPRPYSGVAEAFTGGLQYPSGHASNAVLMWGLLAYLLLRFARRPLSMAGMVAAVVSIAGVVGVSSLLLDYHWFSDIIGGWLAGALILWGVVLFDHRWAGGVEDRLGALGQRLRQQATVSAPRRSPATDPLAPAGPAPPAGPA